jgi:hypothetical protein
VRLLLTTIAIAAIYVTPGYVRPRLGTWLEQQRARRSVDEAVRSTAYCLREDQTLKIPVPPNSVAIRILTNAAVRHTQVPPASIEQPRDGWRYAVEYQLCDEAGTPHEERVYHLRTRLTEIEDPDTGNPIGITWFQDSDRIPAQTRTIQIPIGKYNQVTSAIHLRLANHDNHVEEVVVRVYAKQERQGYEQPYTWSRLSQSRRERISRCMVYPPDLLHPREKQNLLRWVWAALPPAGREGTDYEAKRIYQQTAAMTIHDVDPPPENGFQLTPNRPVTIAIPSAVGIVRVEPGDYAEVSREQPELLIRRYRPIWGLVEERKLTADEFSNACEFRGEGETLELTANVPLGCRVLWSATIPDTSVKAAADPYPGSPLEHTSPAPAEPIPLPTTATPLRSYQLQPTEPLVYRIAHHAQQDTPLRLTLRRYHVIADDTAEVPSIEATDLPTQLAAASVTYELRNEQGRIVQQGEITTAPQIAAWDHGTIGPLSAVVTEPRSVYLQLTPDVKTVELRCESSDVAVSAFTRPLDLPRVFPSGTTNDPPLDAERTDRTWFVIQPEQFQQRILANLCLDLQLQQRPPTRNVELIQGEYHWEDFAPVDFAVGQFVLTRRDPQLAVREEAIESLFLAVDQREQTVTIPPHLAGTLVEPTIIYESASPGSGRVSVWLDDEQLIQFTPRAVRGEVRLPKMRVTTASAKLRVEAPEHTKLMVNYLHVKDSNQFVKRFMYGLQDEPLSFLVPKDTHGPETLMLRFLETGYAAQPSVDLSAPSDVQAELIVNIEEVSRRTNQPLDGWTLRQRKFRIQPDAQDPFVLLDGKTPSWRVSSRCAVVLDADLQPGLYRVTVQSAAQSNSARFLSLYRVTDEPETYRSWSVSRTNDVDATKVLP